MIKIATLNVKGLNNRPKAQKTLTLLKSYNLDIIMIQETNLKDPGTRQFLSQIWGFDSFWSSKTAILAGKKNIKLTNKEESYNGRVIKAKTEIRHQAFLFINVYTLPGLDKRTSFFRNWSTDTSNNI